MKQDYLPWLWKIPKALIKDTWRKGITLLLSFDSIWCMRFSFMFLFVLVWGSFLFLRWALKHSKLSHVKKYAYPKKDSTKKIETNPIIFLPNRQCEKESKLRWLYFRNRRPSNPKIKWKLRTSLQQNVNFRNWSLFYIIWQTSE